ncbi:hypothetical protein EC973_004138 [Apophysomyces ossiformis]|uniref:Rap-GAP domain-containing protein n=1 Tax=Apophysomyces ossiformis TaxID=679940 RepID=A0A8H7EMN2_9FUNG|nr:hypothetical protein EC973_004138 [Apophysomyces ossiformis]
MTIVDAAARLLRRDAVRTNVPVIQEGGDAEKTDHHIEFSDEVAKIIQQDQVSSNSTGHCGESPVGKLLFGKEISHMEFFESDGTAPESMNHADGALDENTRSERITPRLSSNDNQWSRQRAKSCQECKVSLSPLSVAEEDKARYPTKCLPEANLELNSFSDDIIHYQQSIAAKKVDLSSCELLRATTLITLQRKLNNDCDEALAYADLAQLSSSQHGIFPEERLRNILYDLRTMSAMIEWEDGNGMLSQKSISVSFAMLEKKIIECRSLMSRVDSRGLQQSNTGEIAENWQEISRSVKEIVSSMRQITNCCISQHYKVLQNAMIIPCKGYKIEGSNRYGANEKGFDTLDGPTDYAACDIEHLDKESHWFRNYFAGRNYVTFCGHFENGDPALLTAICESNHTINGDDQKAFRMVLRTKQVQDIRKIVPYSFLLSAPYDLLTDDTNTENVPDTTWKQAVEMTFDIPFECLRKVKADAMVTSGIESEILKLDENGVHKKYKFGVLYIKEGQVKEEEWFSNQHDSENFANFLNTIGKRVYLRGYSGWAAGLDTKSGDSGEYTYTNIWKDNILTFHVSTLIPSRPGDKQQIQRKRHIGNVFVEGKQAFDPTAIKSQFLHVFIVIHEEEWNNRKGWRVEVVAAEGVPEFGPPLPDNPIFFDKAELSSFILAKCK